MQYASNAESNYQYYWNKANKIDHNLYLKADYRYSEKTNLYLDLQRRNIEYIFQGPGELLTVKGGYCQVRWRMPVPDVWLRTDQLEPWT